MVAHAFALRSGNSGPQFDGNAGDLLTLQSDGRSKFVPPSSVGGDHMVQCTPDDLPGYLNQKMSSQDGAVLSLVESTPGNFVIQVGISPPPFRATYYVDPASTRAPHGSETNPYTTIAQALAAAAAFGVASAIIFLPPATTIAENVVFPTAGNWEIAAQGALGYQSSIINGTVTCNSSVSARYALTNVQVTGAVTGVATGSPATRLRLTNTILGAGLTLTGTGGAVWRVLLDGSMPGPVGFGGAVTGACAVVGAIFAFGYAFFSTVSCSVDSQFDNVQFGAAAFATTGVGAVQATFYGCTFTAATTFTASATLVVQLDGASAANLLAQGATTSGTVLVQTINANRTVQTTVLTNVTPQQIAARTPQSLMVAEVVLTTTQAGGGGSAGNAVVNVIYTDMTGTLVTKAVTTALDVTQAAGTEVRGSFPFHQNGATVIQYSVTGVTTPGLWSASLAVSVRQD